MAQVLTLLYRFPVVPTRTCNPQPQGGEEEEGPWSCSGTAASRPRECQLCSGLNPSTGALRLAGHDGTGASSGSKYSAALEGKVGFGRMVDGRMDGQLSSRE